MGGAEQASPIAFRMASDISTTTDVVLDVFLYDRSGDRTHDLKIKSLLLYQLSYPVGPCKISWARRLVRRLNESAHDGARTPASS